MDGLRRRPDVRRRRPDAPARRGRSAARWNRPGRAWILLRSHSPAPRRRPSPRRAWRTRCRQRRRSRIPTGLCRRTAPWTGASSGLAASGCRFPASTACLRGLSILFVFSLLIGPVNYWLLWRKRQQVLLVLTAPVISAIFILLLAGYVVAGEGLGVRGRAVTFTMLDQVRKQASTRATMWLYAAGMTPSSGLRFARDGGVPGWHRGTAHPRRSPWISPTRRTRRGHSGALSNQSRGNRIPAGAQTELQP